MRSNRRIGFALLAVILGGLAVVLAGRSLYYETIYASQIERDFGIKFGTPYVEDSEGNSIEVIAIESIVKGSRAESAGLAAGDIVMIDASLSGLLRRISSERQAGYWTLVVCSPVKRKLNPTGIKLAIVRCNDAISTSPSSSSRPVESERVRSVRKSLEDDEATEAEIEEILAQVRWFEENEAGLRKSHAGFRYLAVCNFEAYSSNSISALSKRLQTLQPQRLSFIVDTTLE